MKHSVYILAILTFSCSGFSNEELFSELKGRSYEWNIHLEDSLVATQQLYFINDSLMTLVFEDEDEKFVQFGSWNTTNNLLYTYLNLKDVISESSFQVNSWNGEILTLSKNEYSYKAVLLNSQSSTLTQDIIGSWIAPLDSFPRTLPEFEESGEFLMNPIFKFSNDSFNIRTEDFKRTGTLKVIEGTTKQLILESETDYMDNKIIIIEQHSQDLLELRIENDIGLWNLYELVRVDDEQKKL